ncbi:unnamed protein product [Peniophora sp. CBMAI 1063]|nr:unnamed protein product [Peniophora sp. CBMAI 1063]
MSFDDPANSSLLFSDLGSPSSGAYTQSSPRPATVQPHRLAKPRLEPARPTSVSADPGRTVSMPETTPVFQVKRELKQGARIVSMPSQPGNPAADNLGDLSMSSEGASGNSSSLYTGTSLASISESDTSGTFIRSLRRAAPYAPSPVLVDSVIIIEHNDGLAEGFLRQATIKEEVEEQEKMSIDDQGWISWTRSPPRPIPALHGPLSLPYARCPSGAEGTIIDEPENLPRMIWGLDSESQATKFEEQTTSPQPPSSVASPALAPEMFKQAVSAPVKISAPPAAHSSPIVRKTVRPARGIDTHAPVIPLPVVQAAPQTRQGFASMGNIANHESSGFKRVPPHTFHQQPIPEDSHQRQESRGAPRQPNVQSQNQGEVDAYTNLPRTVKAHDFPLSTTVGAMKVSARPAPGSALPQIVIEPRSPENFVAHNRPTAIELAQQYQRQLEHQALRNIKPSSYLPTPPSTTSPLWSSNFSPYPESLPSPSLSEAQALAQAIQHHQTQLRVLEQSEQLRRLVHERLEDMNSHSVLEPAAQISSLQAGGRPTAQVDYSQLSNPQDLLAFLARNEQLQAANVLAQMPAPKTRTLSGQSASSMTSAAERERRLSSSSQMSAAGYGLASPTSPDIQPGARGYQPRSIPLARLIQRRLSSVPEESDSSATIRGRSSSPPPAIHGLGLESDKRQWTHRSDRAPGGRILAYDYVDRPPRPVEIERAPRGPDERSSRGFDGGRFSRGQAVERSSIGFDSSERQPRAPAPGNDIERAKVRLPAPREASLDMKSKPIRAPLGPRVGTPSTMRTQPSSTGSGRSQPPSSSSSRSRIVDDRETENDHSAARKRTTRESTRGSGSSSRESGAGGHGRSQRKPAGTATTGRG